MVVKKIKNQQTAKRRAWQIGDLVDYIRYPHDRNPQEKVEYAGGQKFLECFASGAARRNGFSCQRIFS